MYEPLEIDSLNVLYYIYTINLDTPIFYNVLFEVSDVSYLSSLLIQGSVSSGDLSTLCQSEAVLPKPLAHFS